MKKELLIIIVAFIIIILFIIGAVMSNNSLKTQIQKDNKKYEKYLNQKIYGAEVLTLINDATEQNKTNEIQKNEKGRYISNGENSIRVDIIMGIDKKVYPMESILDADMIFFVEQYSTIEFKCTNIYYHNKTGRVSGLMFEEIEESSF